MHDSEKDLEYLDRIRRVCSGLPEAEESQLQDRPMFHVRRRRFVIFNPTEAPFRKRWQKFGQSIHFATNPSSREEIETDRRFQVSPHHGFRGWLAVDLREDKIKWAELKKLLVLAYRHVANKELLDVLDGKK